MTFHVASLACCLTEERSCSWKMRPSSSSWESRGGEVMALSCPCWPSLAPAYLGWAGAMGAKTCHLGSNSGITGSCARSNFTHFGFDQFLAPLQIVNLHRLIGLPSQQNTNTQQREFQDIRKIMDSERERVVGWSEWSKPNEWRSKMLDAATIFH